VQVPELPKHRRDDLEKMLSIFDQSNRTTRYILNIQEEEVPAQYRDIVRRLQKAASTSAMQANMEAEDFLLEAFRLQERQAQMRMEEKDKALVEKDKALKENAKALEENAKALEENAKVLEEKDRALEESQKIIEALKRQLKENNPDKT
jgi:hypothetical protein